VTCFFAAFLCNLGKGVEGASELATQFVRRKLGKLRFSIAVVGSYVENEGEEGSKLFQLAEELGRELAKNDIRLVFAPERNVNSLPMIAAASCRRAGGRTLGVMYGTYFDAIEKGTLLLCTGLERGGPREFEMIRRADAVIAIRGGCEALMEMPLAILRGKPVIVIKGTGGWSDVFAERPFDEQGRERALTASTAQEAVELAIRALEARNHRKHD